jgi:HEPN domain-containing protein
VRGAILTHVQRLGLHLDDLLAAHAHAEHLPDLAAIVADIEERYGLGASSLALRIVSRAEADGLVSDPYARANLLTLRHRASGESGALPPLKVPDGYFALALLEVPDAEFLTMLEHAAASGRDWISAGMAEQLFAYADQALRAHGAPYRRVSNALRFEWVGDPAQHALTVQPALVALADARLAGARDEFEHALALRRRGGVKELEDAIEESCKAVESTLKILIAEFRLTPPKSQQLVPLYDRLAAEDKLPGYMKDAICASGRPRNHLSSHGQGPQIREIPEEVADAAIAAAATAITFLAHYLP